MSTLLIVDDDAGIRRLLAEFLEDEGFQVRLAENGAQAVQLSHSTHPDLILMDLRMPIMDGATAIRLVKSDPATDHIPIIAMSAERNLRDPLTKLLSDGVVAKPFDMDALIKQVRRLLAAATAEKVAHPVGGLTEST